MSKQIKTFLYILTAIITALFIISFAISVPILFRPFYYMNITSLNLVEQTGYSYQTIVTAFNELMDYMLFFKPFSVGELSYSASGVAHFADCRVLFWLDLIVMLISAIYLIVFAILKRKEIIDFDNYKISPSCVGSFGVVGVFLILGIWAGIDFNSLFTSFHLLFFAGKDNWQFSSYYDPVINILPFQFWFNCVILIGGIIFLICFIFILYNFTVRKRRRMLLD